MKYNNKKEERVKDFHKIVDRMRVRMESTFTADCRDRYSCSRIEHFPEVLCKQTNTRRRYQRHIRDICMFVVGFKNARADFQTEPEHSSWLLPSLSEPRWYLLVIPRGFGPEWEEFVAPSLEFSHFAVRLIYVIRLYSKKTLLRAHCSYVYLLAHTSPPRQYSTSK